MKKTAVCLLTLSVALLLIYPKVYIQSFSVALQIFASSVLPVLFIFSFICKLLTDSGSLLFIRKVPINKLFRVSGAFNEIFLSSIVCGYPIGAKMTAEYYEKGYLFKSEIEKTAMICSGPNPLFCVATVGALYLNDIKYGYIILISNILSTIMSGILYRKKVINEQGKGPFVFQSSNTLLYDSMQSALQSSLTVGGFFCCFYVFTSMLQDLLVVLFPTANSAVIAFILGCFEMTRGCLTITSVSAVNLSVPLCCFFTNFGGLCILAQTISYYKKCHVNCGKIFLFRICQGLLSASVGFILCLLC